MSPKNEQKDGVLDIPAKSPYAQKSGSGCEGKFNHKPSSNSIQFELGPPTDSCIGKLQVRRSKFSRSFSRRSYIMVGKVVTPSRYLLI